LPVLVQQLAARGIPLTAIMTDLYPNLSAFQRIAGRSRGLINFERLPVDARAVPPSLRGLRTLFNGFHHFKPDDAVTVLRGAVASGQPIAIFELSERSLRRLLPILLTPLFIWLVTPFMHPFRWRRLLWTHLVPLVPLTCFWDGLVSQLRAYTPAELERLAALAGSMRWRAGQVPLGRSPGRLTYLIGIPIPGSLPQTATRL
jgi:hypothetical protein